MKIKKVSKGFNENSSIEGKLFVKRDVMITSIFDNQPCPADYNLNAFRYTPLEKINHERIGHKYLLLSEDGETKIEFNTLQQVADFLNTSFQTTYTHVNEQRLFKFQKKRHCILVRAVYGNIETKAV